MFDFEAGLRTRVAVSAKVLNDPPVLKVAEDFDSVIASSHSNDANGTVHVVVPVVITRPQVTSTCAPSGTFSKKKAEDVT
jgi:hypothetical protein